MDKSWLQTTPTPLGPLWLCTTEVGLCSVGFGDAPSERAARHLARRGIAPPTLRKHPTLDQAADQLTAYFERRLQRFDLPLDLRGTPFQLAVWDELLPIPYGQTLTYGEIALEVEQPRGAQAVGQAVGANPVAVIVPCHRVVAQDGDITGYAAGIDRKSALLELEQAGLQLKISFQ